MSNWFEENAPGKADTVTPVPAEKENWFAKNAPVESLTGTPEAPTQPKQFPQYSPVNAGIKRPDLGEQYKKDTAAGPFTKPGAAEAATNVGTEGLKTAAIATAAGVGGAGLAASAVEASPAVLGAIGTGAKWVKDNPIMAGLAYHVARELGLPLPKVLDVLARFKE
jgi:hypothetical protein